MRLAFGVILATISGLAACQSAPRDAVDERARLMAMANTSGTNRSQLSRTNRQVMVAVSAKSSTGSERLNSRKGLNMLRSRRLACMRDTTAST